MNGMVGRHIRELGPVPAKPGRVVLVVSCVQGRYHLAAYHDEALLVGFLTRDGVIFEVVAHAGEVEVSDAFVAARERLKTPLDYGARSREDWFADLVDLSVERNARAMYDSLERLYKVATYGLGRVLPSVRPARVRDAVEAAVQAFCEADEDIRDATRIVRPIRPATKGAER